MSAATDPRFKGIVWGDTDREVLACLVNRILAEGWQRSEIADHPDFQFMQQAALDALILRNIGVGSDGKE
jgi:hypothetical protein